MWIKTVLRCVFFFQPGWSFYMLNVYAISVFCLFLSQSRSLWRCFNKQWKTFVPPHSRGLVESRVDYWWHQDVQRSGTSCQGSEDLRVLSAWAGKDDLTQGNNEIWKVNIAQDLIGDRGSRTGMESLCLKVSCCLQDDVWLQMFSGKHIPFSYPYTLCSHVFLYLVCSEFVLQLRPSEFPATRHSKSSSHICGMNTDSMKTKRKGLKKRTQGLKKKKKRKKLSRIYAWAVLYSAQKETMN